MATARYKVPSRQRREETERIAVQSSRRRGWRKVVSLLACTVVFCTTYALILPAITQESSAAAPHIHDVTCYTAVMEEGEKTLTCPALEGDELHEHTDDCYTIQMVQKDAGKLTCADTDPNHVHSALCYGQWELNCPLLWTVAELMVEIEALPSADEIEKKVAAYEAAHDTAGEEKYYTQVTQKVSRVYEWYKLLSPWQKEQVVNADKLMELEFIWSRTPLALVQSIDVYMINTYSGSPTNGASTVLFNGNSAEHYDGSALDYEWWTAIVVEQNADGTLTVAKVNTKREDKLTEKPSTSGGFVLMVYEGAIHPNSINVSVGDFVFASFDRTKETGYTGAVQGTVSFYSSKVDVTINSPKPNTTWYTSTKDFVELNLFDYYGSYNTPAGMRDINYLFQNADTEYPGFQWNAGAYPYKYYTNDKSSIDSTYGWIADRNYVDCIDFGNSLITDYRITTPLYVPSGSGTSLLSGDKSESAIGIASSTAANGAINAIWYDTTNKIYTDRPIGISSSFGRSVGKVLNQSGYPQLYMEASWGQSLQYLFYDDIANGHVYADKKNSTSIDGLFKQHALSGAYYFDSRRNHAQYNASTGNFVLYDETITPNFILYPFGNFLPFNDIADQNKATQVYAFQGEGGAAKYLQAVMDRLRPQAETQTDLSQVQLYRMLRSYMYNWMNWADSYESNGRKWDKITAGDAINDYFNHSSEFGTEFQNSGLDFNSTPQLQSIMKELYNIDFDVPKNFFFGMEMKMNFMMPKDGLTGSDNGNNATGTWGTAADGAPLLSGSPDGIPDYRMNFYFAGDDDVWVFIDGILFLDLTGIHRHVGGKIDFVEGRVYYYEMDSYIDGTISEEPYYSISFADILTNYGGIAAADLGKYLKYENGAYTTFLDYSTHKFNFYYMERGSGSSVCRINFNFPMLRENSISVSKENLPDKDVTLAGDPDYYFNIMVEDNSTSENKLFVGPGSKTGVETYKIMDSAGNYLKDENGKEKVFETDEFGIFSVKAGQTAIFEGIKENLGDYYVQELIREDQHTQYNDKVTINGGESRYNDLIDWQYRTYFSGVTAFDTNNPIHIGPRGYKWYGYSGPKTDSGTNSTFYFQAINGVVTSKLGKLNITKALGEGTTANGAAFDFKVTLDGKPLAEGTKYLVNGTEKTVAAEGIITVPAGQTATIEGILSGTAFTVQETTESAKGYTVTYQVTDADEAATDGMASGIIRTETTTSVTATNTENRTEIVIPGHKELNKADENKAHKFHFNVQQVDEDGKPVDDGYSQTHEVEFSAGVQEKDFSIIIGYSKIDRTDLPMDLYYKITEQAADDVAANTQTYLAQVNLYDDNGTVKAELVSLMDHSGKAATTAAFTNTLLGDLEISKQVIGGTDDQRYFRFTVTLRPGNSGLALSQLPTAYAVSLYEQNAAEVTTAQWSFKQEDGALTFSFYARADERLIIHGIPLGVAWTVEEDTTGYWLPTDDPATETVEPDLVKYEGFAYATDIYVDETHITGASATGQINASGTAVTVAYTNSTQYSLPATGGVGTGVFTVAGSLLMLFSAAWLLYKRKRRREAY